MKQQEEKIALLHEVTFACGKKNVHIVEPKESLNTFIINSKPLK